MWIKPVLQYTKYCQHFIVILSVIWTRKDKQKKYSEAYLQYDTKLHLPLLEKLLYPFLFFQSSGWLEQKQKPLDFEHLPLGEINKLLEVFYAEAKGKNADYSRSTLTCIRAGINRYLRNPPFQRDIAITMAPEFSSSNKMLSAVLKNMKREGKDKTKSYPPISENDLAKIQNFKAFNIRDPKQF